MVERTHIHMNEEFEKAIGYSRAIRVGKHIFVSGTTAFSDRSKVRQHMDSYEQSKLAIENIDVVLRKLSSSLREVVRTNVFVCPATDWNAVGRAHGEYFGDIRPISTFLWTSFFSNPEILVEIEADAVAT